MRCSSYCTANSYRLTDSKNTFERFGFQVKVIEKVLHLSRKSADGIGAVNAFLFHFGCIIIWGSTEQEELEIISAIAFVERTANSDRLYEPNNFDLDREATRPYIDEESNIIYLPDESAELQLAISYALAQSIKLRELEKFIRFLLERTKPIQEELAKSGEVKLSKNEISKQLGLLFYTRSSINTQSDVLHFPDIPEIFVRRPDLEPIYLMGVDFNDIPQRQRTLNNNLSLAHELYTLLSSDLQHKRSTRLEVIIIILIATELFLTLLKENFFTAIYNLMTNFGV